MLVLNGCVSRGLYQIRDGRMRAVTDSTISDAELTSVREVITKDLERTGFTHGIPPFWHLRVCPAKEDRNEFVYVLPLLSFHWDSLTIGNIVNWRVTDAPTANRKVQNWPWSGDTNLFVLWQSRHAYYAVCDEQEIVLYKDYVGSVFFLPVTRLFLGPREVAKIKRAAE
jgi:hypothetical protein